MKPEQGLERFNAEPTRHGTGRAARAGKSSKMHQIDPPGNGRRASEESDGQRLINYYNK